VGNWKDVTGCSEDFYHFRQEHLYGREFHMHTDQLAFSHALTARESNENLATSRYELSLLLPRMAVTLPPPRIEQLDGNIVGSILRDVGSGESLEQKENFRPQSHVQGLLGSVEIPGG
jgi:hypothetical protein